MHARVFDHAGSMRGSRNRTPSCCLPQLLTRRHPETDFFHGSMAGLHAPLPTLRRHPRGYQRTARGRCDSLSLHRNGLSPPTLCRSVPAHNKPNRFSPTSPRGSLTSTEFWSHSIANMSWCGKTAAGPTAGRSGSRRASSDQQLTCKQVPMPAGARFGATQEMSRAAANAPELLSESRKADQQNQEDSRCCSTRRMRDYNTADMVDTRSQDAIAFTPWQVALLDCRRPAIRACRTAL